MPARSRKFPLRIQGNQAELETPREDCPVIVDDDSKIDNHDRAHALSDHIRSRRIGILSGIILNPREAMGAESRLEPGLEALLS